MSAPWEGELRAADGFAEWICDAEGVDVAQAHETVTSEGGEIARALVHRANAYPKLVEALDEIAGREHADSCALVMTDGTSSCTCHVVIALETIAALASTREEG